MLKYLSPTQREDLFAKEAHKLLLASNLGIPNSKGIRLDFPSNSFGIGNTKDLGREFEYAVEDMKKSRNPDFVKTYISKSFGFRPCFPSLDGNIPREQRVQRFPHLDGKQRLDLTPKERQLRNKKLRENSYKLASLTLRKSK